MRNLTLLTIGAAIFMYSCKTASFYTKKGDKNFEEGQFEHAIQNYQQAIEKGAEKGTSNFQIAESYRLSNRLSSAKEYYKDAIDNGVSEQSAPFYYGMSLKSTGDYAGAKQVLDDYVKVARSRNYQKLASYESKKIDKIKDLPFTKWKFEFKNEQKLNTDAEDYAPVKMGDKIVITSSRGEGELYGGSGYGFSDLYVADKEGSISKLDETGKINILNRHDATPTFTPDGNTMIFARGNTGDKKEDYPDVDLYMSTKDEAGNWSEPERLPINLADYWEGTPFFDKKGEYLYFASDRKGGRGGLDLYKAQFKDGKFAKPRNLGKSYNTFGNEMFPYIHEDGSFYLASDGHVGFGGLDMFKIIADKNTGKLTGDPVNMGASVNTTYDDFGMMYTSRFEGYMSSNREGGLGSDDIYSFKEEIIPFYFLDLEVSGKLAGQKIPVDNAGITFMENDAVVESNFTNKEGHYKHQLHKDGHYEIKVEKDSFFTATLVFNLDKTEIEKNEKNDDGDYIVKEYLTLKKFGDKEAYDVKELGYDINDILYDLGSYEITADASKELDKLIGFLQDNPGISIELGSHTDSRDSEANNLLLSTKRSESAVNYILTNGKIDKSKISSKGYGESRLLNKCKDGVNCTEEEHQANRRTEIKILDVKNVNSEKYQAYLEEQKAIQLEKEREERHEQMEEEELMIDELKEEIAGLEKKKLTEEDAEYKELEEKKAKLAEIEKHFKELEEREAQDGEILKKKEIEGSDEYLEMKKKYEEMQKMMKEMEEMKKNK